MSGSKQDACFHGDSITSSEALCGEPNHKAAACGLVNGMVPVVGQVSPYSCVCAAIASNQSV